MIQKLLKKNGTIELFKYVWRIIEMPLINCEINLISAWSANCVISSVAAIFAISDAKGYVPVMILSTQDSAKLLKSCFKMHN